MMWVHMLGEVARALLKLTFDLVLYDEVLLFHLALSRFQRG